MNDFCRYRPSCGWSANDSCWSRRETSSPPSHADVDVDGAGLPSLSSLLRTATGRCLSCSRSLGQRSARDSSLPCRAWLCRSTEDFSAQRGNVVIAWRHAASTTDYRPPQRLPRTSPIVRFPSIRSHRRPWQAPPFQRRADETRVSADWFRPRHLHPRRVWTALVGRVVWLCRSNGDIKLMKLHRIDN